MLNIFKKNNDYVDHNNIYADYQKVLKVIETTTYKTHVATLHCIHQFFRKWTFKYKNTFDKDYNTLRLLYGILNDAYDVKVEEWMKN